MTIHDSDVSSGVDAPAEGETVRATPLRPAEASGGGAVAQPQRTASWLKAVVVLCLLVATAAIVLSVISFSSKDDSASATDRLRRQVSRLEDDLEERDAYIAELRGAIGGGLIDAHVAEGGLSGNINNLYECFNHNVDLLVDQFNTGIGQTYRICDPPNGPAPIGPTPERLPDPPYG